MMNLKFQLSMEPDDARVSPPRVDTAKTAEPQESLSSGRQLDGIDYLGACRSLEESARETYLNAQLAEPIN